MVFPLSILGGLFLIAFGLSRVKAARERESNVQKLFTK